MRTEGRHAFHLFCWALVSAVVTAGTAMLTLGGATPAPDRNIRAWMLSHRHQGVQRFFESLTVIAAPNPLLFLALGCSVLLLAVRRWRAAVAVAFAPLAAMAIYDTGKSAMERVRPAGAGAYGEIDYSFPSAHATMAAAVFCSLAYVLWKERFVRGSVAAVGAALVIGLVGLSRVYLDVHWFTDVLGGWSAGLTVATITASLYQLSRSA